jgi:GDP-L-fucose synthase
MDFYQGKKILVAGGNGLIGSHTVQALLDRGAQVRATVHSKPPVVKDDRIDYLSCDLTKREECAAAVAGMDYVILCAANTSGAAMITQKPIVHITTNLLINSQVLEAACLGGVERLLFVSSTTVYPAVTYPVKEEEGFKGEPHSSYMGVGWMKRYIEKLAEFYHERYDLKIALIRPTNIYGPYDKFDFATSHVLPALIRRAVEQQNPFEVWGDGSAVRDFIYVSDLVEALLLALEKNATGKPINIGSGRAVTIKEAVELILELTGNRAEIKYDPTKPTTIPFRMVDLTQQREVLGFQPKVSFEEGLQRTIAWYRSTL